VAAFGGFLADLGYQPMVRHVAITVETAPSGGTTLRDYVAGRLDPGAPAAARAVMGELVDVTPATSADVDTRVSITFGPARPGPLDETASRELLLPLASEIGVLWPPTAALTAPTTADRAEPGSGELSRLLGFLDRPSASARSMPRRPCMRSPS
jgi:hypothetical protein